MAMPFDEDRSSIIFAGYQVDDTWSELNGAYAVNLLGNQIKWISDLDDFAGTVLTSTLPKLPLLDEDEYLVKPKQSNDQSKKVG